MKRHFKIYILALIIVIPLFLYLKQTFNSPNFNLDKIYLTIDSDDFKKLEALKDIAKRDGLLKRSKNDYVPCTTIHKTDSIGGKIRLKGDWIDHLGHHKWSFRVKLKDSLTNGIKTFNLQSPKSRDFLKSFVYKRLLQKNGILSNEMTFIELIVNNTSWGIYNMEEHLSARMIQHQNKPNGVILKFEDSEYFEADVHKKSTYGLIKTADIKIYGNKKNLKKNVVDVDNAKHILKQYQFQNDSVYHYFDEVIMAKYYAISDILRSYHGMGWINIRFYYNFNSKKMEPIGYDGFPELNWGLPYLGKHVLTYNAGKFDTQQIIYGALKHETINTSYYIHLNRLSDSVYLAQFLDEIRPEIQFFEAEIQKEFKSYVYDWQKLFEDALKIRNALKKANSESLR